MKLKLTVLALAARLMRVGLRALRANIAPLNDKW